MSHSNQSQQFNQFQSSSPSQQQQQQQSQHQQQQQSSPRGSEEQHAAYLAQAHGAPGQAGHLGWPAYAQSAPGYSQDQLRALSQSQQPPPVQHSRNAPQPPQYLAYHTTTSHQHQQPQPQQHQQPAQSTSNPGSRYTYAAYPPPPFVPPAAVPTTEKPYGCDFCPLTFARQHDLKRHVQTHNPDKPYSCTFPGCTSVFTRKDALKRHQDSLGHRIQ